MKDMSIRVWTHVVGDKRTYKMYVCCFEC